MNKMFALVVVTMIACRTATAQELSPLIVETLGPEPTLAKTGDVISQSYPVTHYCKTERGEEIKVAKERMQLQNLSFSPFVATGLKIEKLPKTGKVCNWRYTYSLRIIDKEKIANRNKESDVAIPSITFYWVIKQAGVPEKDLKVFERQTEKGFITYHSTIPDSTAFLDIKEYTELGNFKKSALVFRIITIIFAFAAIATVVFTVKRLMRKKHIPVVKTRKEEEMPATEEPPTRLSRRAARRQFKQRLKNPGTIDELEIIKGFYEIVRSLLLAEISEFNWSFTPTQMLAHIEKLSVTKRKEILLLLAEQLCSYQKCLDTQKITLDPIKEKVLLKDALKRLRYSWLADLKYKIKKHLARV